MAMVKGTISNVVDLVMAEKDNYLAWLLEGDNVKDELKSFSNMLIEGYPNEFQKVSNERKDGYNTKSIQMNLLDENVVLEFTYTVEGEHTFCELYKIEKLTNDSYLEF